ncbi:MAG: SAM-dependent methyltransferase [Streptosporangiales bacterium]|nr:SAM-dependent methyltransferase [Streptosporangiales bacterium]
MIGGLYEETLHGRRDVHVEYACGEARPFTVDEWLALRPGDESLLARCVGPTLDVGCGPGRFVTELAARGQVALGIDVTPAAVGLTARAGGSVLLRDVFDPVPGTGRWQTVLLADGNVGIGGDPVALFRRVATLLAATGRVLVDADSPGTGLRTLRARLRAGTTRSEWFDWATVGVDALAATAEPAGLAIAETWAEEGRWLAALVRP